MAAESKDLPAQGRQLIRNIGLLLSGDLDQPIVDSDCLLIEDGVIVGFEAGDVDSEIDAQGCAVMPGLIDSHTHPVFGDWTPRQNQLGWIEMNVNGAVTSFLSAGEVHLPGRPKDAEGVRALAMVAQRCFQNFRPIGAKVIAGAPVPELDFDREFYASLKAAGIARIGEIGLGTVAKGADAARVTGWCRELGIETIMHTGGPSIAGSHLVTAEDVLEAQPDVVSHINGGPTSIPHEAVRELCKHAKGALEAVHNGNEKSAIVAMEAALANGRLADFLLGTDAPAGSGVQPNGMLRMVTLLASFGGLPAEQAICCATGNVSRKRGIDQGLLARGRPADIVFMDKPEGSSGKNVLEAMAMGNIPGIGAVMIDGKMRTGRSRSTPPAARVPSV
ncbi:amidohydrolase family protein [Pararhodobacter oceanensis]|uniref:Enamidase n=1 Tax=Pararhodobacter oceanensis TaxID=2172121 RepID=A0A2T8HRN5_9RHOB|nr:amidohydrolase family protein [Pararhodobacter oceanensis]PVH28087.1 Enamidase [Pararhodobacter oceanensis]